MIIMNSDKKNNLSIDMTEEDSLIDLSSLLSLIQIRGVDAAKFLQGQITCDIRELENNHIAFAACCDHKGRVQANFWIWLQNDSYYLLLPTSMRSLLLSHLKKYAVFSKVELISVEEAWEILTCSLNHMDQISNLFTAADQIYQKIHISEGIGICSKIPGKKHRYLIVTPKDSSPIGDHLKKQIPDKSLLHWHYENITAGLALIYPQTQSLFTPQMINLEKWGGVSFTKGCYVGQEVIARTQHLGILKRHLCIGEIPQSISLTPGDTLINEQNEALGVIIDSCSPSSSATRFLAVVQDRAYSESSPIIQLTTSTHEPLTFLEKSW